MTYTPNFNNRRTQKRVIKAIAFVKKYLREDRPQALATRWIHHTDNFGNQQHPLSRYLREKLLICSDERYNKDLKITKKYLLNKMGLEYLLGIDKITQQTNTYSVTQVQNKFQQELDQGIEYKETHDRKYHWLQNTRRREKRLILAQSGLTHTYDIVCSCPTLLHQYSQQIPLILDANRLVGPKGQKRPKWLQGPMDLYLFNLRDYIKNRKQIRYELAIESEQDPQRIKRLINGMFQGGQLNPNTRSRCYEEFDGDVAVIKFLQQHPIIQGLREDIKIIWQHITPVLHRDLIKTKSSIRKRMISGKQKAQVYRDLESRVRREIETYLIHTNNKYYFEHDGWSCSKEIDIELLTDFVRNKTEFQLEFDYEFIGSHDKITQQTNTYSVTQV